MNKAIGLIEVIGFTNAVIAADESLKCASVELLGVEKVDGGIVTVKLIGDVSAISAAVEAGKNKVINTGHFRAAHVIPRLDPEVLCILQDVQSKVKETKEVKKPKMVEEQKKVTEDKIIEEVQVIMTEIQSDSIKDKEEIMPEKVSESEIVDLAKETKEVLTEDKYSKLNVKELRKLAITMRVVKTLKEAKQLKKDELIIKLLNKTKESK